MNKAHLVRYENLFAHTVTGLAVMGKYHSKLLTLFNLAFLMKCKYLSLWSWPFLEFTIIGCIFFYKQRMIRINIFGYTRSVLSSECNICFETDMIDFLNTLDTNLRQFHYNEISNSYRLLFFYFLFSTTKDQLLSV